MSRVCALPRHFRVGVRFGELRRLFKQRGGVLHLVDSKWHVLGFQKAPVAFVLCVLHQGHLAGHINFKVDFQNMYTGFKLDIFHGTCCKTSVADPDSFDRDPDPAFTFIRIRILRFNLILIRIRLFHTDLDPEVMHLKTVLFIHLNLIFLVHRSNRTQPKDILC